MGGAAGATGGVYLKPDKVAFHSMGRELTYGQIDQLSAAFCAYPQQFLGVRKGDRIAVMLPNYAAFPLAFLGVTRAGAIQVHVNRQYMHGA